MLLVNTRHARTIRHGKGTHGMHRHRRYVAAWKRRGGRPRDDAARCRCCFGDAVGQYVCCWMRDGEDLRVEDHPVVGELTAAANDTDTDTDAAHRGRGVCIVESSCPTTSASTLRALRARGINARYATNADGARREMEEELAGLTGLHCVSLCYAEPADLMSRGEADELASRLRDFLAETPLRVRPWRLGGIDAGASSAGFDAYVTRALASGSATRLSEVRPSPPVVADEGGSKEASYERWLIDTALEDPELLLELAFSGCAAQDDGHQRRLIAARNELERERGGSSFHGLFGGMLSSGCLSPRRVYREAVRWLESRPAATVAAVARNAALDRMWTRSRALDDVDAATASGRLGVSAPPMSALLKELPTSWYRWRGTLAQYSHSSVAGRGDASACKSVNVVLVHGFGAFLHHYRGQLIGLADAVAAAIGADAGRVNVYAVTLPGFGRSGKPPLTFSQRIWSSFLADFVEDVVDGSSTFVVGNSIGGYTSAVMASTAGPKVKGLVLLNSAGPIADAPDAARAGPGAGEGTRKPPPQAIIEASSRLLFWYLQRNVGQILRRCYPTNPDAADAELSEEIRLCSEDPGALYVFQSVFFLPPPRPLNVLCEEFGRSVLVLQGGEDPLNDAVGRASRLGERVDNAKVVILEAGHCPHDETVHEVNRELSSWIAERTLSAAVL